MNAVGSYPTSVSGIFRSGAPVAKADCEAAPPSRPLHAHTATFPSELS